MSEAIIPEGLTEDACALVRMIAEADGPGYDEMTVGQAREASDAFTSAVGFPLAAVGSVEDVRIDSAGGAGAVGLRIYRPVTRANPASPALLYFHGGGWVVGDLESHDNVCRRFCCDLGWPVIAVDYRLAPEHPFPAAIEDCFSALRWLVANAGQLGVDAARIAVGGDSAGGGIAAVLALAAREGIVPPVAFQTLIYPVTDLSREHPSYARVQEGMPVTAAAMRWFRRHYLPDEQSGQDWRASPLLATSMKDLAKAFVVTMHYDPLCDEGVAYARRIEAAGGECIHLHFGQNVHGIANMGALMRDADTLMVSAVAAMRAALETREG